MSVTPRTGPVELLDDAEPAANGEILNIAERLVLSPVTGRFYEAKSRTVTTEGELVEVGDEIGTVGETVVRAPMRAWFMRLMVLPGELVREGQPVAWLRPL